MEREAYNERWYGMCATCKHFTTDGAYKMNYDGFCMKNFWDVDVDENCENWEKKEG